MLAQVSWLLLAAVVNGAPYWNNRSSASSAPSDTGFSQYVNVFIGTQGTVPGTSYNGGNVFPGASMPFGGVKVGIDTTV